MSEENCQNYKKELYENVAELEKLLADQSDLTKSGFDNLNEKQRSELQKIQARIIAMYDNVFWSAQKMKRCELKQPIR